MHSVQKAISTIDAEIIVVDNNSTDDSCLMLKQDFPEIILIENQDNIGFSKANNQGVAIAKGKYICILNPDTVIPSHTFSTLISYTEKSSNIGIIGPKLIDGSGEFLPESKRNAPSLRASLSKLFGIAEANCNGYYATQIPNQQISKVDILVGAFMFTSKEIFTDAGGFDEAYFMYFEDTDLSYKLTKNRYDNIYYGPLSVIHFKGESTHRNMLYVKRFYTSMKLYYRKNYKKRLFPDSFVFLGLKIFSLLKICHSYFLRDKKVQQYYLISDSDKLAASLSQCLSKQVVKVDDYSDIESNSQRIELILDQDYLSYDQIIQIVDQNTLKNVSFKIHPKNANHILGSTFKNGKGAVLFF